MAEVAINPPLVGEVRYCPSCEDEALARPNGTCVWCDTETLARRHRAGARFTDRDLRHLYTLHIDGSMSIRALARSTYERYGFASVDTCKKAIYLGWKRLHLEPRSQAQASRLSGVERRAPGSPGIVGGESAYRRWQRNRDVEKVS